MTTRVTVYFKDQTNPEFFPKEYKKVRPYLRVVPLPEIEGDSYSMAAINLGRAMGLYDKYICQSNCKVRAEYDCSKFGVNKNGTFDMGLELCFKNTNGEEINLTRMDRENSMVIGEIPDDGRNHEITFTVNEILRKQWFKTVHDYFSWNVQ